VSPPPYISLLSERERRLVLSWAKAGNDSNRNRNRGLDSYDLSVNKKISQNPTVTWREGLSSLAGHSCYWLLFASAQDSTGGQIIQLCSSPSIVRPRKCRLKSWQCR
jgi:hypothetical protein